MARLARTDRRGFTLVEVLVVVAIVGIIATLAVSTMSEVVPAWRLRTAATDVAGALAATRARAITQNRSLTVLFQADSYTVFVDANADGAVSVGETVVETHTYGRGIAYYRPTTTPLPVGDRVVLTPRGIASNLSVGGQGIGVRNTAGETREIRVFYSGLVRRR